MPTAFRREPAMRRPGSFEFMRLSRTAPRLGRRSPFRRFLPLSGTISRRYRDEILEAFSPSFSSRICPEPESPELRRSRGADRSSVATAAAVALVCRSHLMPPGSSSRHVAALLTANAEPSSLMSSVPVSDRGLLPTPTALPAGRRARFDAFAHTTILPRIAIIHRRLIS